MKRKDRIAVCTTADRKTWEEVTARNIKISWCLDVGMRRCLSEGAETDTRVAELEEDVEKLNRVIQRYREQLFKLQSEVENNGMAKKE